MSFRGNASNACNTTCYGFGKFYIIINAVHGDGRILAFY